MNKGTKHDPETHTVSIIIDKKGNIDYENGFLRVCPGDTVVWKCKKGCPFSIHVGWNSPLDKGRYQSVKGEDIVTEVSKGARFGHYEYSVAVFCEGIIDKDKGTIETVIWTDDPPLIVKRPPRH